MWGGKYDRHRLGDSGDSWLGCDTIGGEMIELPLKIQVICPCCGSELKAEIIRTEVLDGIGVAIEVYPCHACAQDEAWERDLQLD